MRNKLFGEVRPLSLNFVSHGPLRMATSGGSAELIKVTPDATQSVVIDLKRYDVEFIIWRFPTRRENFEK